jgi:cytochrome c peroxidase
MQIPFTRISGGALVVVGGMLVLSGFMTSPTLAKGGGGGGNSGGGHGGRSTPTPTPTLIPISTPTPTSTPLPISTSAPIPTSTPIPISTSGGDGGSGGGGGGDGGGGNGLAPLSRVIPPQPSGGTIVNQTAAVQLGKALFWDEQAGGDGQQACASCHFHAGEDISPGSNGVVAADFNQVDPNPAVAHDDCTVTGATRQVTGRNAPSVINAVFNRDNFWDGRGNHNFNGFNPLGLTGNNTDGVLVNMTNSSLASQATGPANSPVEMACAGRPFNGDNSLASKMLARPPLQFQQVSPRDSVLGSLANPSGNGLNTTYGAMVQAAFGSVDPQANFSSIWGQAVQAYEATLISDQTPMDRYLSGIRSALTSNQQQGLNIFTGKGNCTTCHAGPEMTDASVNFYLSNGARNRDGGDQGFHNIGVRPTNEDLGRAGLGPNGVPWSVSGSIFDRGAFKTPSLRNIGLRAPYFHNGGKTTLTDVVNFYNRGGDFANAEKSHDMKPLSFGGSDISALVDFLQNGLTDCRVAREQAPFDHPSLVVSNGISLPATGGNTCS